MMNDAGWNWDGVVRTLMGRRAQVTACPRALTANWHPTGSLPRPPTQYAAAPKPPLAPGSSRQWWAASEDT